MRRCLVVGMLLLVPFAVAGCKSPSGSCTKICDRGKACGDTCIDASETCRTPPGSACGGR
jgi:hypothetical protein